MVLLPSQQICIALCVHSSVQTWSGDTTCRETRVFCCGFPEVDCVGQTVESKNFNNLFLYIRAALLEQNIEAMVMLVFVAGLQHRVTYLQNMEGFTYCIFQ